MAEAQLRRRVPEAPLRREQSAGKGPEHGHNLINDSASGIEIRVKSSVSCSAPRSCCRHPQAKVQIRTRCVPRDKEKSYFRPNCLHIHQSFQSLIRLCLFSSCRRKEARGEAAGRARDGGRARCAASSRSTERQSCLTERKLILPPRAAALATTNRCHRFLALLGKQRSSVQPWVVD